VVVRAELLVGPGRPLPSRVSSGLTFGLPTRRTTPDAAQTTGGATPSALAARSGSQPHTVQAYRIAERPKSSAARCGSGATRTSSQSRMYSPSSASQCAVGGDSVASWNPSGAG